MRRKACPLPLLNVYGLLPPPKHPHPFLEARNGLKTGWRWMLAGARVKVMKMAVMTKKKTEVMKNRMVMKNGTIMTTETMGMMTKAIRKL